MKRAFIIDTGEVTTFVHVSQETEHLLGDQALWSAEVYSEDGLERLKCIYNMIT